MERDRLKTRSPPFVPPGFEGLTSFHLIRIYNKEAELCSDPINLADVQKSLVERPWILLHNQSSDDCKDKDDAEAAEQPHISLETRLPKGVLHGCPSSSDCLKVTARWRPEEGRKEILEEVPVFHPTEEEFHDTINFIASIRSKVEPYGICRIVPPPCWTPPSLIKKNNIWEGSPFVPQVQQIAGIQCPNFVQKVVRVNEDINAEKRSSNTEPSDGASDYSRNPDKMDSECLVSTNGPEFTLKSFKKYAEDFKSQYFLRKNGVSGLVEPTSESIEGEYRRIVENPSEEIEVLYGHDICSTSFGSGFPEVSNSSEELDKTDYMRTGWNLNNLASLPGSLLAYETRDTCHLLVPRLQVGMCFSSQHWRVEEHHLYSLCYMHDGAPRIIYSVPGSCSLKFEAVVKKQSPSSLVQYGVSHNRRVTQPAISSLKSESIPVYRCVQYPGEFVLVLPGAYRSSFDSGFNCAEEVNFAPLDWLPHGQNILELYHGRRRKTSLSHDKILLGAAQDAVKAHWLSKFRMSVPNKLLKWIDICKKDAVLANALKLRIKCERIKWEYLATSLVTHRRDTNFDASSKKECCICFCDLHLSAVGCSCSAGKYSCLVHAKQFCSCPWGSKFVLFLYEINELDTLTAALEGKLSSIHKWATEYLGLSLHKTINGSKFQGKAGRLPSLTRESEHNQARFQEAARPSDVGKTDASSITAQPNAYVQSNSMNKTKSKEITNFSAANSFKTLDYSSLLQRKRTFEAYESSSDSSSDSSSSDSDVELIEIHNHSTKK